MTETATITFENDDRTKKVIVTAKLKDTTMTMNWNFGNNGVGNEDTGLYLYLAGEFMEIIKKADETEVTLAIPVPVKVKC